MAPASRRAEYVLRFCLFSKKVKKEKWRWRRRRRSRWRRSEKGGSDGGVGEREGLARGDVHERDGVERIEELTCSVGTRKVATE